MPSPMISRDERAELLDHARRRCFFVDVDDAGARLCRASMPYGIAKIHWVQRELGCEPDACYFSTPDSTVTRNVERWSSGFGYGGAIDWSGDFVPLELKPNCCGMLVVGLRQMPDMSRLRRVVARLIREPLEVDGLQARWDLDKGNHFLNLYRVSNPEVTDGCPLVAIMHSSGRELRGPNPRGPGLYLNAEPLPGARAGLSDLAEVIETPFGPAPIVKGESAQRFNDYVAMVDGFAHRRRVVYAREIFGPSATILFNETHQGFPRPGRMLLGCYQVGDDVPWVPVTLREDLPAYLIAAERIYDPDRLEQADDAGRELVTAARETGSLERLRTASLLPHGGGYAYPDADGGRVEVDDRGPGEPRRYRVVDRIDWFENVRELPFAYRGEAVIRRLEELGAGRVAAKLEVVSTDLAKAI